jgi:hypothetical protein
LALPVTVLQIAENPDLVRKTVRYSYLFLL